MRERKSNTRKNNDATRGNEPEINGERRKIKKMLIKDKTIQTKQDIPKQGKKILRTSDLKEKPKNFGVKYGHHENIIKKPNGKS